MGDPGQEQGEGRVEGGREGEGDQDRAPLGMLFLAAAVGLGLILTVVGLIAFAALSR